MRNIVLSIVLAAAAVIALVMNQLAFYTRAIIALGAVYGIYALNAKPRDTEEDDEKIDE